MKKIKKSCRRVVFVDNSNIILFEDEVNGRGICDTKRAALNLLLRGVSHSMVAGKLRVFVEKTDDTSKEVETQLRVLGRDIKAEVMSAKVLSGRQKEIADMIVRRLTNKEISTLLNITVRTVKFHISVLLHKFGVTNRHQLCVRFLGLESIEKLQDKPEPVLVKVATQGMSAGRALRIN